MAELDPDYHGPACGCDKCLGRKHITIQQTGRQYGKTHAMRIEKLRMGDYAFGHAGRHHGSGKPGCPRELHHHHDVFCAMPTEAELKEAGIDPEEFKARSRA